MKWINFIFFVVLVSLYSGVFVVNYLYDDNFLGQSVYSVMFDDDVFRQIVCVYLEVYFIMYLVNVFWKCKEILWEYFIDGIINGVKWFSVLGGM